MTSLWLEHASTLPSDPLPEGPVEDLVVGAGITGLVTGLLQGTKYSRLLRYQSKSMAEA